jgi:hypothetical protein
MGPGEMGKDSWQLTAGSRQLASQLPSVSLGHYASLLFVVKGRSQRSDDRGFWGFNFEFRNFNPMPHAPCPMLYALCDIIA